jgi:hypothetical protein
LAGTEGKRERLRTEVLDVEHLRASLYLQALSSLSSDISTDSGAVLSVVGNAKVENGGKMRAVELDELNSDGLLLPEFEDAVDRGSEVEVGAAEANGKKGRAGGLERH